MSWGTELWDQYDNVSSHTLKGIDFLDRYSHFLRDRCSIETKYASDLKNLVRKYQPKKKEQDEQQFSWSQSFLVMLKELHDLAGQHEVIAENTQTQLVQELNKLVGDLKTERRKHLSDGSKVSEQLKNSLQLLEKAKSRYDRMFRESEKSLEAHRRAEADINLSRAEVEKTRTTSNQKSQQSEDSKNEYASQLQNTNQQQRAFYTSQMPQVFQCLQDVDERRINQIKSTIRQSANLEQNVLPIITTCIHGMLKAADDINSSEDCRLVIEKYKSGFNIPEDIPFEDLNQGLSAGNNVSRTNTSGDKNTLRAGTVSKNKKSRGGLLGMFASSKADEQAEDFSHLPPNQRKNKLQKKLEELQKSIAHETAERDGMLRMKEVYQMNPALGDPNSLDKKVAENAQKLDSLQAESRKYEGYLAECEGGMRGSGRVQHGGSDESLTTSITSAESGHVIQNSAPGTPQPAHNNNSNLYEPVEDPATLEADMEPVDPAEDEFSYPVIGTCRALYGFDAVNEGSVGMDEGEEMYVLEQDQGDGWTRVRKNDSCSSEGFVPTSYIQCHFYDQDAV